MTFLHRTARLRNQYFVLRHGQSKANTQGIILSHPHDGQLEEFTLTEEGERQVRASVEMMKASGELGQDAIIISSPFSRCKRTAEIAKETLGTDTQIIFDERLRERWFGDHERKDNTRYDLVWQDDKTNPSHTVANVESASDVQKRTSSLIEDLESRYEGKNILLVSHGDALRIMQTGFAKQDPSVHRSLRHLETAEIRKLDLASD
jgi:probable phosphoglycerate mutase